MGKVSSKNNRRSRHKTRMPISRDPTKGRFTDVGIASKWNRKLTVAKNFALLGVTANVNTEAKVAASRTARLNKADIESLLTMMDEGAPALAAGSLVERNPTRAAHFMKAEEIEYLRVSGYKGCIDPISAVQWCARDCIMAALRCARCAHHLSLRSLPYNRTFRKNTATILSRCNVIRRRIPCSILRNT